MEIKYIKSAAKVLNRDCVNKGGLDLSKNVLWVSVGQGAADLSNPLHPHRADQQDFFLTSSFDSP